MRGQHRRECLRQRLRLLQRDQVPCPGDHLQAGAGDAVRQLLRFVQAAQLVLGAVHHQRRARDVGQLRDTFDRARTDVATAESLLDGINPLSAVVYADAFDANPVTARLTRDVVVVASRWQRPARASDTAFEPGAVDGMAYVFDFATRKVTCAGEVHATNSKSLEYTYNETYDARGARLDQTLQEDLDRQLARAVAEPNTLFVTPY